MLGVYNLPTPIGFSYTRTLGLKHGRVFFKRGHLLKKREGESEFCLCNGNFGVGGVCWLQVIIHLEVLSF